MAMAVQAKEMENSADIMTRFKELTCKYPTAFLFHAKGFEHRIDTVDAPPIDRHSDKKSPVGPRAIKAEIERMLKLKLMQQIQSYHHAPWYADLQERGKLKPSRFVIDYHRLNSITHGDDPVCTVCPGKLFAKCDSVSSCWQIAI